MNNSPKISIIMPSLNQAKYVEKAIKSVISQQYKNKEFIVIDGGSTDGSVEIIEKYKNEIDYTESEKDICQNHAVNKGILKATGDIIGWINSDDTYEADALSKVAEYFTIHPEVDVVYGITAFVNPSNEILSYAGETPYDKYRLFNVCNYVPCQSTFFRKKCLAYTGLLDLSLKWCGDWDLWRRMAQQFNIQNMDEYLANWLIHNESISYNPASKIQRSIETIKSAYKYNKNIFSPIIVANMDIIARQYIPFKPLLRKIKNWLK